MSSKIHPSLKKMAVEISSLTPLKGNPRVGNVEAIMASYSEFGQVKPIVARKNEDGTATVLAGNHQLAAAEALGWNEIAVVFLDADDKRANAFAIADNRTMELGYTDPELLMDMLLDISEYYPELMESLEWDEFELANYESDIAQANAEDEVRSVRKEVAEAAKRKLESESGDAIHELVAEGDDGERRIFAPSEMDQSEIAVRGSSGVVPGAAPQAVVQYTIVFDTPDQQGRWYEFIRWLRSNPSIDGTTTSERLMNFIGEHCEV